MAVTCFPAFGVFHLRESTSLQEKWGGTLKHHPLTHCPDPQVLAFPYWGEDPAFYATLTAAKAPTVG